MKQSIITSPEILVSPNEGHIDLLNSVPLAVSVMGMIVLLSDRSSPFHQEPEMIIPANKS